MGTFVQFFEFRGVLHGEARSNEYLDADAAPRLGEEQIQRLNDLGWLPPDADHPMFWKEWELTKAPLSQIADLVMATLEVYDVDPTQVRVEFATGPS